MCHSTIFWYTCDHLIPTDTLCPFKETLIDHTKATTKTAYVEDACCLCKQPCSPSIESLRANLISVQKLTSVFQLESRDGHFPEEVTRFFATGEHLEWKRPGATPATPVSAPAPVQALTPSPTVVDASPAKTRRATAQAKKSPSTSKPRQSPMGKQSQNKQSPTPQMDSSPANPPAPQNTQPTSQPTPENTLPVDSVIAEALIQWERESSDPDNDFTTVNFDAIKSVCELEEQIRAGSLPRGSQIDGSLTVSLGVEFQHDTQTQASHHHPQHGLPSSLQQQPRGTPYDGTNWGQEGVYLPSENYYFVGDKAQAPITKGQMPLPLSAMDPLNEQRSFSTYTTLDVDDSDAQSVNKHAQEQQHYYIEQSVPLPAHAHSPQPMPMTYEQTQQCPVTHLSPKDIHRLTPSLSRSKGKSKAKSSGTPSVTIIDGSNATSEHNTATTTTTTTTKRTSKNKATSPNSTSNAAKDPTKGVKDSTSRVTKSSSTPSSGNKKSSKANTKNATTTTTTTQQQQQQQQQPNSRKQWVSIPRPPPEAIIVPQSTQQQLQYAMPSMLPCF